MGVRISHRALSQMHAGAHFLMCSEEPSRAPCVVLCGPPTLFSFENHAAGVNCPTALPALSAGKYCETVLPIGFCPKSFHSWGFSDCPVPVVACMRGVEVMDTVLEGKMACVSLTCVHSFALHPGAVGVSRWAGQWGVSTRRTQAFSREDGISSCTVVQEVYWLAWNLLPVRSGYSL